MGSLGSPRTRATSALTRLRRASQRSRNPRATANRSSVAIRPVSIRRAYDFTISRSRNPSRPNSDYPEGLVVETAIKSKLKGATRYVECVVTLLQLRQRDAARADEPRWSRSALSPVATIRSAASGRDKNAESSDDSSGGRAAIVARPRRDLPRRPLKQLRRKILVERRRKRLRD